jgi:hypothetical protein
MTGFFIQLTVRLKIPINNGINQVLISRVNLFILMLSKLGLGSILKPIMLITILYWNKNELE